MMTIVYRNYEIILGENVSCPFHCCLWVELRPRLRKYQCFLLCRYQFLVPMGGERAYQGAIDIFENKMSIIPTQGLNRHDKYPLPCENISTPQCSKDIYFIAQNVVAIVEAKNPLCNLI